MARLLLAAALALLPGARAAAAGVRGTVAARATSARVVPPIAPALPAAMPSGLGLTPAVLPAASVAVPRTREASGFASRAPEARNEILSRGETPLLTPLPPKKRTPRGDVRGAALAGKRGAQGNGKRSASASLRAAAAPGRTGAPSSARWSLLFDGGRTHAAAADAVAGEPAVRARGSLRPAAAERPESRGRAPASPAPAGKLPPSYRLYLAGLVLAAVGQSLSTFLIPVYGYMLQGAGLAVLAQFVQYGAVLPGSAASAWAVGRFGPRTVYSVSNAAYALTFLSVPLVFALTGGLSTAQFLIFSAVAGAAYGAQRGVAEQAMVVRLLGRGDAQLLKKAGSMYYLMVAPAYIATAFSAGFLLGVAGEDPLAGAGGLLILASLLPFSRIRYRAPGSAVPGGSSSEGEGLSRAAYAPYVFFYAAHLLFYSLFGPLFAVEVLGGTAFIAWLTGFYALGNFLVSLVTSYRPGWVSRLDRRGWTLFGAAGILSFLWATLAVGSAPLSLALALWMGMGVTAGQVQWQAHYQRELPEEAQPAVFRRLSFAYVGATVLVLGAVQAAFWLGAPVSVPWLLGAAALAVSGAAAAALALSRRA